MDIIVVCHAEFGFVRKKRLVFDEHTKQGVSEGVANLVRIAERYRAKPTFVVMPEVVEDFPKTIQYEIGLHVHPKGKSLYLSEYPFEEQSRMIREGKETIRETFGREPRVFVGGRWAFNNDTAKALVENGFTHDCSAMPRSRGNVHWRNLARITLPYHPSENDYQKKGSLPLLIVPVSQGLLGASANPEEARVFGLPWLKACFEEYYSKKAPVFHIALHSLAMTDPFYLNIMDSLLGYVAQHPNIHFKFASEITETLQERVEPNPFAYIRALNGAFLKGAARKLLGMKP
ncbi:MAG: PTS alpha-glucoside transporter subunit IIBC [Candidatus Wildermuthbacteria bacterium]|nr:PTS alpha-glucoside transporter subunit IIBC [Candidatus Wildermuthbacteria bacterium]